MTAKKIPATRLSPSRKRAFTAALSAIGILLTTTVHAANLSWTSNGNSTLGGSGAWDTTSSLWWTGSAAQAWTTNTTAGDTAIFGGTAGTVTLGTNINALGQTFSTTGYTIGLNGNTLALGTGGIDATALTSGTTAISGTGGVGLAGNQTWDVGSGATLAVSSGISSSTAGTKILTVQGSGDTTISGAITAGSGAFNLNKRGTGTLTLSGGAAIGAGSISNGNANNLSAVLLGGTTKISSGTYTSAGEFVVGGVLTNGGAGVNTNFTMDGGTLTGSNYLSLGRGNGVGAVSSDILLNNSASLTAANFSAGFNGGNTANLPKGTVTLNGTSGFTISGNGVFNLAESTGSNMSMTLNGSSTLTVSGSGNKFIGNGGTGTLTLNGTSSADFGTGLIAVGQQNGNGTLNVNTGTTFNSSTEIRVAYSGSNGGFTGTGTINVGGGTLNTNSLTVGRNNNDVASTMTGTVNVTSGTLNVKNGTSLIGWRGIGVTGTVNVSGGSFNQGTTAAANMVIGSFNGANGAVNVSGTGALTLQNNSSLLFSNVANGNATRTLTISGGNTTFYSDAGTTVGGTGVIDLMNTSNPTGVNTINLDGGTLTANQIKAANASGTRVINFNGGTLKTASSGSAATFLASGVATTANVRNGGAIIDTNGIDTTVGQALTHSAIGGDNATDGGLTKNGTGILTLSSGGNTFTGATKVNAGTLALGGSGSISSSSGITVASGAIFDVSAQSYTLGSSAAQTLRGAGNVTGAVSVASGSTVAAGIDASTIGTLAFSSTLTGASGATFSLKLDSTAGTFDLLTASGAVNLNSATLVMSDIGSGSWNGTTSAFSIVHGSSIGGIFFGLADGSTVNVGSNSFTLNYTGTDVTLTAIAIPEPSTYAAIIGALVLAGAAWNRRRPSIRA